MSSPGSLSPERRDTVGPGLRTTGARSLAMAEPVGAVAPATVRRKAPCATLTFPFLSRLLWRGLNDVGFATSDPDMGYVALRVLQQHSQRL